MRKFVWVVVLWVVAACTANPGSLPASQTKPTPTQTGSFPTSTAPLPATATLTLPPMVTVTLPATATLTSTATTTATPIAFQVCSPLQDISLAELSTIVTTPFKAPTPGQDNGHHGVDFAYYHHGTHTEMLGLPIYSVLSGQVAAVVNDLQPYGNAIIIETPLANLPADFLRGLNLQFQPTPAAIDNRLTCPTPAAKPAWMPAPSTTPPALPDHYSLYILYAHMKDSPTLTVGEEVTCGQTLGAVGNTGNSGNPHLHLETRFGPAGATFTSLSHYNNLATAEEMSNYCTWRVSGVFQLFDPMIFFNLVNSYP